MTHTDYLASPFAFAQREPNLLSTYSTVSDIHSESHLCMMHHVPKVGNTSFDE